MGSSTQPKGGCTVKSYHPTPQITPFSSTKNEEKHFWVCVLLPTLLVRGADAPGYFFEVGIANKHSTSFRHERRAVPFFLPKRRGCAVPVFVYALFFLHRTHYEVTFATRARRQEVELLCRALVEHPIENVYGLPYFVYFCVCVYLFFMARRKGVLKASLCFPLVPRSSQNSFAHEKSK